MTTVTPAATSPSPIPKDRDHGFKYTIPLAPSSEDGLTTVEWIHSISVDAILTDYSPKCTFLRGECKNCARIQTLVDRGIISKGEECPCVKRHSNDENLRLLGSECYRTYSLPASEGYPTDLIVDELGRNAALDRALVKLSGEAWRVTVTVVLKHIVSLPQHKEVCVKGRSNGWRLVERDVMVRSLKDPRVLLKSGKKEWVSVHDPKLVSAEPEAEDADTRKKLPDGYVALHKERRVVVLEAEYPGVVPQAPPKTGYDLVDPAMIPRSEGRKQGETLEGYRAVLVPPEDEERITYDRIDALRAIQPPKMSWSCARAVAKSKRVYCDPNPDVEFLVPGDLENWIAEHADVSYLKVDAVLSWQTGKGRAMVTKTKLVNVLEYRRPPPAPVVHQKAPSPKKPVQRMCNCGSHPFGECDFCAI
jgi:hypothetical protein